MNKITALRKKVDGNIKTVDILITVLEKAKDNAVILSMQAQDELEQAEKDYDAVRAGCNELQKRCKKVWKFVNKITGE